MGVLPIVFRQGGDAPTVQFQWIDYLSNVGYARFYPCASKNSVAQTYFLSTQGDIDAYIPSTEFTTGELNFDFTFKVPMVVQAADAIVNFTQRVTGTTTSSIVVKVIHVDAAAAETVIGTFTCPTRAPGATIRYRECCKIALTQKAFKVGENIRLSMEVTASGAASCQVYHDPTSFLTYADDFTRTVGSDITFDCPFKIQT